MAKKETSVKKGAKKSATKDAEVAGHKKKSAPIKAAKKAGAKKEVDVEGHVVRRDAVRRDAVRRDAVRRGNDPELRVR